MVYTQRGTTRLVAKKSREKQLTEVMRIRMPRGLHDEGLRLAQMLDKPLAEISRPILRRGWRNLLRRTVAKQTPTRH